MKFLAPILVIISLAMACFTDPQGVFGVWVSAEQVVAVLHPAGDCIASAQTKIVTQSGTLCVREPPLEVLKRLNEAK